MGLDYCARVESGQKMRRDDLEPWTWGGVGLDKWDGSISPGLFVHSLLRVWLASFQVWQFFFMFHA